MTFSKGPVYIHYRNEDVHAVFSVVEVSEVVTVVTGDHTVATEDNVVGAVDTNSVIIRYIGV